MQEGSWGKLSVIGGISFSPYGHATEQFTILRHNAQAMRFIQFLLDVRRRYRRRLIVIWDGLRQHGQVSRLIEGLPGSWVDFIQLPSYAPELNPVESLWSQTKANKLANFTPHNLDELQPEVERVLTEAKHKQRLLHGFFRSAGLDPVPIGNLAEDQ